VTSYRTAPQLQPPVSGSSISGGIAIRPANAAGDQGASELVLSSRPAARACSACRSATSRPTAAWMHSTLAIVDRRVIRALAMRIARQSVGIRVIEGVDRILGARSRPGSARRLPGRATRARASRCRGARGGQLPCRRSAAEPALEPAHSAALRQPPDSIFLPEGEIGSQPPPKSCSPAPFVWPGPLSPAYR